MNMNDATEQTTLEVELLPPELSKLDREYQAFLRLLPALLETHKGQYVAIHEEKVLDSDEDPFRLIERVREIVGRQSIHVGPVVFPQPIVRIPHYREYRPGKIS